MTTNTPTTTLAPELEQIRGILEGWKPNEQQRYLRNELLGILDTIATPAIYNADAETLRCPHCEWIGIVGKHTQAGQYGCGFRLIEDEMACRDIVDGEAIRDGLLTFDGSSEAVPDDAGRFARLECRNCLGECALPEGLEIDFV